MSDTARLKKGKAMFKKAYGSVLTLPKTVTPYTENTLKNLFGEIYTRKVSMRDRRLLILGALAGLGADPGLFEIHARSAVENGEIKPAELEEFCLILVNYCGYPKVSPLYQKSAQIMADAAKKKK